MKLWLVDGKLVLEDCSTCPCGSSSPCASDMFYTANQGSQPSVTISDCVDGCCVNGMCSGSFSWLGYKAVPVFGEIPTTNGYSWDRSIGLSYFGGCSPLAIYVTIDLYPYNNTWKVDLTFRTPGGYKHGFGIGCDVTQTLTVVGGNFTGYIDVTGSFKLCSDGASSWTARVHFNGG